MRTLIMFYNYFGQNDLPSMTDPGYLGSVLKLEDTIIFKGVEYQVRGRVYDWAEQTLYIRIYQRYMDA